MALAIDPPDVLARRTAPRGIPQHRGMLGGIWARLFGERIHAVRVEDHSRFIGWLGRTLAPILLITFSLAAVIVLAGQQLTETVSSIRTGSQLNVVVVTSVVTALLTVIAMDVCMLLCALLIRDALSRGQGIGKWLFYAVFGLLLGTVEGLTFYRMLVQLEAPADIIVQLLDIARSALAPACAVFLTVIPQRQLNREEIDRHILAKTAAVLLHQLDAMALSGQAAFRELLELFLHLSLPDNPRAAQAQAERDARLTTMLERLSPQALAMDVQAARIGGYEAARADMEAQIAELRAMLEATPARRVARAPSGATERDSVLQDAGITLLRHVTNRDGRVMAGQSLRGGWIRSTDITTLSGGKVTDDAATAMARELGKLAKDGRAYACPLMPVLRRLSEMGALIPAVAAWYTAQRATKEPDSSAVSPPSPIASSAIVSHITEGSDLVMPNGTGDPAIVSAG
ncbi:MAG: hypothetical protein KGH75_00560 [Rhodospirillales bacterium]|nr:hypothetical protein [Rhodospirillales bacterium]